MPSYLDSMNWSVSGLGGDFRHNPRGIVRAPTNVVAIFVAKAVNYQGPVGHSADEGPWAETFRRLFRIEQRIRLTRMIGTTINGRFRVNAVLGRGGMGSVYRATDLRLKREVAIKTIDLATQAAWAERLRLEAEMVSRLSHNHVVRLYDMDQIPDGPLFLVMEFVEGSTLLRKFPNLTIEEKLRILAETSDALDEAHQLGIVHRDIKPGNILLTKDLHAKLTDFGLAMEQGDKTEANALRGTVPYMAPEMFRNVAPSPSSDLYALGVVAYEAVTGELPFRGTTREIVAQVTSVAPESPRHINPDIPAELDRLILELLEKDPGKRPHRAAEVSRRLLEIHDKMASKRGGAERRAVVATRPMAYEEPSLAEFSRTLREEAAVAVDASPAANPKGKARGFRRPPVSIISEHLVRELVHVIEDEPLALDPTERYLAGAWLADLLMDQPRGWSLSGGGGLKNESAEMARALLALTSCVVSGATGPALVRAASLIENGAEVRHALSPLVLGRYLAIRETTPGLESLRRVRKELVVNNESVAAAWMDDQGRLLPNSLPRDWKNLNEVESGMPRISRERLRLWNRLADIWAENPDFRRVVLRSSVPWLAQEKAVLRFWPEVVEPLWEEARRRRTDPNWSRRLSMFTPGARDRMEQENSLLELPRVRGRTATGSGISPAAAASPIAPEFHSRTEIVTLVDERPTILNLSEMKAAYDEAARNFRATKGASASHRRLPLGETAHVSLMVSTRASMKASQVRVLGGAITPVELTVPPLQIASGGQQPIIACWTYSDGSLLVKYRDQLRVEKSLAYSARRKKWFPADVERPLTELLKDLGLDMPTGTSGALEPEKLWSKARKWLVSRNVDPYADDADEPDEEASDEDEK
jgi:serine/threonine-protein kinase